MWVQYRFFDILVNNPNNSPRVDEKLFTSYYPYRFSKQFTSADDTYLLEAELGPDTCTGLCVAVRHFVNTTSTQTQGIILVRDKLLFAKIEDMIVERSLPGLIVSYI